MTLFDECRYQACRVYIHFSHLFYNYGLLMFLSILKKIERYFEEYIACACIVTVSACVILQVILRYAFNTGLSWTEELASFAMVWAVYMGASLGIRERYHVRILAFVVLLPKKISTLFIALGDVILLLFCFFMITVGYEYLTLLWQQPSYSPSLNISIFWPHSIVVLGYILISLRILQIYINWFNSNKDFAPGLPDEYRK
ncbi:TRAP transporter small permease [Photobacterium sp. ZSDE20]|uniref:TRAP transporter small permease protein n=1 Tax=Photobacterium pectinilyticum TaxID=2906793 RepID=A0ABT1N7U2_9GAMM|nr:TRAP transporter small permease [Photobacterium sp. ZSDE20]MCQ1060805.1 TRAP transporter small permease [Photobacterium sp. ZSDE20]MDD1828529.1 TRAP transporter small permease [Photobacterium sp. ZSDE20]